MGAEVLLAQTLNKLSQKAEEASKPSTLEFGEVISEEYAPLEIRIHDKLILTEAFLELTNSVKDHWVDIEVYWQTVDDNDLAEFQAVHDSNVQTFNGHAHKGNLGADTPLKDEDRFNKRHTSHLHNIVGRKKMRVYNGLHKGEKVVLLRMRGGQKYLVLDRITPHIVGGEWQTYAGANLDNQETKPFEVTDPKVLAGWKEGATSESKWANFDKPPKYTAGGTPPKETTSVPPK
jgi:hypothetical protein